MPLHLKASEPGRSAARVHSGGREAETGVVDFAMRLAIRRYVRLGELIDLGAPEILLRTERRMLRAALNELPAANERTDAGYFRFGSEGSMNRSDHPRLSRPQTA